MFGPELNDQTLCCLPRLYSFFSRSFSSIKLAMVIVFPEATGHPPLHLLWTCLLELCAKEVFIGYKQRCWGFPGSKELLHCDAIAFACSKALFDCFLTYSCAWEK